MDEVRIFPPGSRLKFLKAQCRAHGIYRSWLIRWDDGYAQRGLAEFEREHEDCDLDVWGETEDGDRVELDS